jgi:hypothetical protein
MRSDVSCFTRTPSAFTGWPRADYREIGARRPDADSGNCD